MSYLDHEPTAHSVGLSSGRIYFWSSLHYPTISIADSNHNNYNIVNNDAHNQNNANGNTGKLIIGKLSEILRQTATQLLHDRFRGVFGS